MILLKAAPPGFRLGFINLADLSVEHSWEKCCNRAHLPGWGGEATALQSSASGVWAAGIPSYHAVCLPNFKARAAIKARKETDRINSPPLSQPIPSFHQKTSLTKMLTSSAHCISICLRTAVTRKEFSLWCRVLMSPGK